MFGRKPVIIGSLSAAIVILLYFKALPFQGDTGPDRSVTNTQTTSKLLQDFDNEHLEARRKEWIDLILKEEGKPMSHRVPDVIGIGVRKCGTGSLQHFLNQHPLVNVGSSEVHYYDKAFEKGIQFYKDHLPEATRNQLVAEKTPAYFTSLPATLPSIIKNDSPHVKLILILCDPVTRAFSDYAMRDDRRHPHSLKMNFAEYLDEYFEPVKTMFSNLTMRDDQYVVAEVIKSLKKTKRMYSFAYGVYVYFIRRWVEVFAPARLMVVNGEQFIRDPGSVLERIQIYLEIPTVLRREDFVQHPVTGLFCLRPYWDSTYDFEAELHSRDQWYDNLICGGEGKGRTRSQKSEYQLDPKSAQKLRDFYRPYNELLYSMLNQRFDW